MIFKILGDVDLWPRNYRFIKKQRLKISCYCPFQGKIIHKHYNRLQNLSMPVVSCWKSFPELNFLISTSPQWCIHLGGDLGFEYLREKNWVTEWRYLYSDENKFFYEEKKQIKNSWDYIYKVLGLKLKTKLIWQLRGLILMPVPTYFLHPPLLWRYLYPWW